LFESARNWISPGPIRVECAPRRKSRYLSVERFVGGDEQALQTKPPAQHGAASSFSIARF
jgi:hypothetical protein